MHPGAQASLQLAMIGNCAISALIDPQARVVWCCMPRFDGDPVFCALLDSANGVGSLMARAGILSKVAMPRQIVVYAAILNALMTFAINLLVLAVLLRLVGIPLHASMAVFPLLLLDLVALTLGVSLLLSPLHVRYHDIGYLWGLCVQIGFWLTPVIYVESMIPDRWRWLIVTYNPMARIVQYSRQSLIVGTWPDWSGVAKTSIAVGAVLLFGSLAFRRLQVRLVEFF